MDMLNYRNRNRNRVNIEYYVIIYSIYLCWLIVACARLAQTGGDKSSSSSSMKPREDVDDDSDGDDEEDDDDDQVNWRIHFDFVTSLLACIERVSDVLINENHTCSRDSQNPDAEAVLCA